MRRIDRCGVKLRMMGWAEETKSVYRSILCRSEVGAFVFVSGASKRSTERDCVAG